MKITRLSRSSWFKVEENRKIIHFDPGYAGFFDNHGIPLNELDEKADLVLISHGHKDHLRTEAISKIIKDSTIIVAPGSCANQLNHKIVTVCPGDLIEAGGLEILVVDAYNTEKGHSTRKVHHKGDFVGYLVHLGKQTLYFAGDTDYIPEMSNLGEIDIAFLPIGATFVMDIEEAVKASQIINPKTVIPMHEAKSDVLLFEKLIHNAINAKVIQLNVGMSIEI